MYEKEEERMIVLRNKKILDTAREERFDVITKEAAEKFNVPISAISIIDETREWFKSCYGLEMMDGPREISFCGHALVSEEIFIIEDTLLDERFANNPYVVGAPFLRFYAGIRLFDRESMLPIGVFCIKDTKPRKISVEELAAILEFATRAEDELNK